MDLLDFLMAGVGLVGLLTVLAGIALGQGR